MLRKQPGFSAIAILTLALGIGANTSIFSVVNAVLLRPMPYPQPDRLVLIRERTNIFDSGSVSLPNYLDWRASQRGFTDLALFRRGDANLSGATSDVEAERVSSARVSYNFLSVLGVPPELGRDFDESDDVPHCKKVALISDGLWKRRFGGSRGVIGQSIMPGPKTVICADGAQIEQALINLVHNAVDAALETPGEVSIGWCEKEDAVEIFVQDEGPGIMNPANLFVPFFTTKPEGSGIGLPLSRQIAEAHGGSLALTNRKDGKGAEALLRLPL